jgi:hypothetical protein
MKIANCKMQISERKPTNFAIYNLQFEIQLISWILEPSDPGTLLGGGSQWLNGTSWLWIRERRVLGP